MKKILFIFALTFLALFGANAQTTVTVNPSQSAGIVEMYPAIEDITYDTCFDTSYTYVYNFDSIVSIDTLYDPHGVVIEYDTNYFVLNVVTEYDTIVYLDTIFSDHYKDLHAVAAEGWVFQNWIINYTSNDSIPEIDTVVIPNFYIDEETGDTIDLEGWLEYIPWLDSLWDGGFASFNVIANFIQEDTNAVGIGDVRHQFEYLIYPNPTSGIINIQGDIQQVYVFDIAGRLITTGKRTIDITKQPAGTYFLHITDLMGSVVVTKVIKK